MWIITWLLKFIGNRKKPWWFQLLNRRWPRPAGCPRLMYKSFSGIFCILWNIFNKSGSQRSWKFPFNVADLYILFSNLLIIILTKRKFIFRLYLLTFFLILRCKFIKTFIHLRRYRLKLISNSNKWQFSTKIIKNMNSHKDIGSYCILKKSKNKINCPST